MKNASISFVLCLIFINIGWSQASISGQLVEERSQYPLAYANVILKSLPDSIFIIGTASDENGRFTLSEISAGSYLIEVSSIGFASHLQNIYVGSLTPFLDMGEIRLSPNTETLEEVTVTAQQEAVSSKMDKKTYTLQDNLSQNGGSVLQAMQNLPGVTVQDGKVQLRGSDQVAVLIDGKQTALTGYGGQSGLDNLPSSAIEKIEIINNPSAKYDANGNAGIINIIYKKNKQEGWNGKIGISGGLGALWERRENLPDIRPQYVRTPKINPSLSLNYRKNAINAFLQADYLYKETLNKNEFVVRTYEDGSIINQQSKRNRDTGITTAKTGIDWQMNDQDAISVSGLVSIEDIIDRGDEPFFNSDLSERLRLWQFLEDEVKTTATASAYYKHNYKQIGHTLDIGFNYTFHREDERYFFDNILPSFSGEDSFKLLSDEHVADFNLDYTRPLKSGRVEGGIKFRRRNIPTDMQFFPGLNSPLDVDAGGEATYKEIIPAVYANYVFENQKIEAEIGLRVEYVDLQYDVDPDHNTYSSDGYNYTRPFPNVRLAYKINDLNKISLFYNRRVDRPQEVDIRIFPKYDDAEIIKVGNPGLRPQFTNTIELGYKTLWNSGSLYSALYRKQSDGTITRLSITVPGSNLIYAIFQNVNNSYNTGGEIVLSQDLSSSYSLNVNANIYRNQIDPFTVNNLYPVPNKFSRDEQKITSGNVKVNNIFHFVNHWDLQISAIYLAADIIPQGIIQSRFSLDMGLKKSVHQGKGELFFNATDLLNTMVNKREIEGQGFSYTSEDYVESQVIRLGYSYKL